MLLELEETLAQARDGSAKGKSSLCSSEARMGIVQGFSSSGSHAHWRGTSRVAGSCGSKVGTSWEAGEQQMEQVLSTDETAPRTTPRGALGREILQ